MHFLLLDRALRAGEGWPGDQDGERELSYKIH
jgi:hypothetical protein